MNNDQKQPDPRLKNISDTHDASTEKDADKLIEVKKVNDAEDRGSDFVRHEEPFDEQMYDARNTQDFHSDEEAD